MKCGDVVQLRSGGTYMTVRRVTASMDLQANVNCDWITEGGEAKNQSFSPEQLTVRIEYVAKLPPPE